jgi:ABC-2 type transport system permease protein
MTSIRREATSIRHQANWIRRGAIAFAATVRKEWQVMMRYWPALVMLLLETILIPLAYWAQAAGFEGGDDRAAAAFAQRSGTDSVAGFIYLGWAVYMWITTMIWGPGSSLRKERMQGSLESLFLTPVSRFTLLFAPSTAQLIPTAVQFTAVGLMLRLVFGVPLGVREIAAGVAVVMASIPVLFALGALVGVSVMRTRDSNGVNAAIRGLIGVLCGITYPIAVLPGWIQPISHALPVTGVLDTLRSAVLNDAAFSYLWDQSVVLISVGTGVGVLAAVLLRLTMRSVRRTGRLGQF